MATARRTLHGCVDGNSKLEEWALGEEPAAPFMGAWIEITKLARGIIINWLPHPSWVRGLKLIGSG